MLERFRTPLSRIFSIPLRVSGKQSLKTQGDHVSGLVFEAKDVLAALATILQNNTVQAHQ